MYPAEKKFKRLMSLKGIKLQYEPRKFPLVFNGIKTSYTPDFYDSKREIYYEVWGTDGALYCNRKKVDLFKKKYREVKFKEVFLMQEIGPIRIDKKLLKKVNFLAVKYDVSAKSIVEVAVKEYLTRNKKGVKF